MEKGHISLDLRKISKEINIKKSLELNRARFKRMMLKMRGGIISSLIWIEEKVLKS